MKVRTDLIFKEWSEKVCQANLYRQKYIEIPSEALNYRGDKRVYNCHRDTMKCMDLFEIAQVTKLGKKKFLEINNVLWFLS